MTGKWYIFPLGLVFASCGYFKTEKQPLAIARVNDVYLYEKDIAALVPAGSSKEDSILMVKDFMNRWASQKLVFDAAEVNLSDEKKEAFNELIRQYKHDLYANAYLEEVVRQTVDTVLAASEVREYYEQNKSNLKTTAILVRLRYLNLPKDHPKLDLIRSRFNNFKLTDRDFWHTYQPQFSHSALNDSVWVEMTEIYKHLPFITPENRDTFIKNGYGFERTEGDNLYIVKVREVIQKNSVGPYEYLKPTVKQILLNKRKKELIKKFETEIINDAIKNRKYEIYE
jgi:hypothetical protein